MRTHYPTSLTCSVFIQVCSPETPRTPVMNYSVMTEDEENYYGNSTLFGAVKVGYIEKDVIGLLTLNIT